MDSDTLDAKVSYFEQLKRLCGDDGNTDDDDDFDEREKKRRRVFRNFFRPCQSLSLETLTRGGKDGARASETAGEEVEGTPLDKGKRSAGGIQDSCSSSIEDGKSVDGMGQETERKRRDGMVQEKERKRRVDGTIQKKEKRNRVDGMVQEKETKRRVGMVQEKEIKRRKGSKKAEKDSLRPENERIFQGLAFFYIPNNDVAPVRRLRINKAKEFGATWVRNVAAATHIIVEKHLEYKDVESLLYKPGDVTLRPAVVNEDYPIDCIRFRAILDCNQKKYALQGQPGQGTAEDQPVVPGLHHMAKELIDAASPDATAGDDLSKYILMMQEYQDLPIDADEDDGHSTMATRDGVDGEGDLASGTDEREKPAKKTTRSARKEIAFEDRFACHRAGEKEAGAGNPNARTIEVLESMNKYYERVNDQWRAMAYRKAIATLKRQDVKISTEEEAYRLPNIGRRLAQKIEEIVTTNRLKRLEYAESEPAGRSLAVFLKIYGVGNKQAEQWIAQGLRTLDDVRQKAKLTANQRVGVERYDDLNTKIPRGEVAALGDVVKRAAAGIDPAVRVLIGGSYRRGAESSHDVDLVVTKRGTTSLGQLRPFLDALVRRLQADRFLVCRLAGDGSKWHGCCVMPGTERPEDKCGPTWRRIDFLLVPESELGAALLYFTGNDIFNRSMRLLASKKGMRLNQRGLYGGVVRGKDGKMTQGELVEARDERRIFEVLGVKWREPHERWC